MLQNKDTYMYYSYDYLFVQPGVYKGFYLMIEINRHIDILPM